MFVNVYGFYHLLVDYTKLISQLIVCVCVCICEGIMGFSKSLYRGSDNINRVYDVIQELSRKKQDCRPMDAHDGEFNRIVEKLRQIFSITSDVKQTKNQWNQLMVLTYLGTLDPIYFSIRPQIMRSSVVSSLHGSKS